MKPENNEIDAADANVRRLVRQTQRLRFYVRNALDVADAMNAHPGVAADSVIWCLRRALEQCEIPPSLKHHAAELTADEEF